MELTVTQKIYVVVFFAILTLASVTGIVVFAYTYHVHEGCEINPFTNHQNSPFIILAGTTKLLYPDWGDSTLKINKLQAVAYICPGTQIYLGANWTNRSILRGFCRSNTEFRVGSGITNWEVLRCRDSFRRTIRKTGTCAQGNGTLLESGYETGDGAFINTLTICFNVALQIAFWSFINQTSSINRRMEYSIAPEFLQGDSYSIGNVGGRYVRNNQRRTINGILGLDVNSTKYIQGGAQQNATYFMENIAPQWQSFNGGNWNLVEISVRNYASSRGVDLKVWTGVHGIATLPHAESNSSTPLYLYVNGSTKALPVPEIYYKVVHNPNTERGVVLIGVNNPYSSSFTPLCADVSGKISWLNIKKDSQQDGFCYTCTVTSFKSVVSSLPGITDNGLLL